MWRLAFAVAVTLGLTGPTTAASVGDTTASGGGRGTEPVRSLLEMRREKVVVQDFDLSCAAAALATVLTYQHGDPVSEREVARTLIRREEYLANPEVVKIRQGFSLLDLKRYADGRGYNGIGYGQLNFEDLIDLAPIMVPVSFNGYNHFVVFRGAVGDRVVLADPAWGNRTMRVERFEDSWLEYPEFGKPGFVVARRDGAEPPDDQLTLRPRDLVMPPGATLRQALSFARP